MKLTNIYVKLAALYLCFPLFLNADIQVDASFATTSEHRSVLNLEAHNNTDKDLRNARIMVLLLDDSGNVVGNSSQWLVNPQSSEVDRSTSVALPSGKKQTFSVTVKTESRATTSQFICSRIVYTDGSIGNPKKDISIKTIKQ